jgi:hypothetical protein
VVLFRRALDILCYPFQLLFAAPVALLAASRAVRQRHAAVQAAFAVALFMFLLTLVATVLSSPWVRSDNPDLGTVLWRYTLPLALLTLVTPPVVYLAVRLWTEGGRSQFADIDRAWEEGVAALAREGFSLTECPLFLVLGLRNERQVRALMNATGVSFAVFGAPEGGSNPLYFYAVKDYPFRKDERANAVYLVLTDASQCSRLVALATDAAGRKKLLASPDDTVRLREHQAASLRATLPEATSAEALRSTATAAATVGEDTPPPTNLRGTMDLGQASASTPVGGFVSQQAVLLDQPDQTLQTNRLAHVCRLLVRARDPFCPLNGVVVVAPFGLLRRGMEQVRALAQAVRQDLRAIQEHALLRCPVLALIGGMEHEPGFGELVRRVGVGPAMEQRIGMRFEPWNPATPERLEALAVHACDRIEGNVYDLFKQADGYNKPGNGKLYNLLCRTRTGFVELLKAYLGQAFGQQAPDEQPMLFAGCYFAATGEIERLKGFLKAVVCDRMLENQDHLQWTEDALRRNAACEAWAKAGMLASGVLIVTTVVALLRYLRQG